MIILSVAVCFYLLFFVFKDKARVGVETLAARKLQQSAQAFILQLWTEVKYLSIYVLIASFPLFAWNSSVQWTIDPETSTKKAKLEIIHWQGFVEFFSFFFWAFVLLLGLPCTAYVLVSIQDNGHILQILEILVLFYVGFSGRFKIN